MLRKKLISIGIPCFNEEANIVPTYKALNKVCSQLEKYSFEYIFVDNGSTDKTRKKIDNVAKRDKQVIGIFLSRNFGAESSGQAALDYANGDAFIFYEADGQDPPELIPKFISLWEKGNDIIIGTRDRVEGNYFINTARRIFYKFLKKISYIDIPIDAGSFGLIDRKVLDAIRTLPEKYRFYRGLRAWVGFKKGYIKYRRRPRKYGNPSTNFYYYLKYSERGIFGFSYIPLDLIVYLGFLLVIFSFFFIALYLLYVLVIGNPLKGSVAILLSIFFFGGIQLLAISTLGKYLQVVVEETKNRPMYIVEDIVGKKNR